MLETAQKIELADVAPDRELLERVLTGDLDAYEGIMRRHNQRLYRLARSIVTDDAEAMDVLQDSYIAAYQRLAEIDHPDSLGGWLARIVRNTALMRLRKNRRYQAMDESDFEKVLNLSRPVRMQRQPDRELANAQLRQVLERCIDELPDAFRTVFMLRAVEQCSISSVAEMLDIKEATVKTRFHRARMLLQGKLLEFGDAAGVAIHEFAGWRCDQVVKNVLAELRRTMASV